MTIRVVQKAVLGIYELATKGVSFLRFEDSGNGGVSIIPLEPVVTSPQNLEELGAELTSLSKKFGG